MKKRRSLTLSTANNQYRVQPRRSWLIALIATAFAAEFHGGPYAHPACHDTQKRTMIRTFACPRWNGISIKDGEEPHPYRVNGCERDSFRRTESKPVHGMCPNTSTLLRTSLPVLSGVRIHTSRIQSE